ncbi:MAG: hypothetical protein AUJ49_04920 [Desulfovibrionaceae bacterium CG1_02_65_16]|nr:MAG: hypothetical protein AUJ49_04920 [Desulfovibrionaceae bacterium CG1_02_65_16]
MIQDIRIDVRWRNHPKRAKLALLLGHDGTGYVLDLWISAAQSKPDGVLRGLDALDIAIMAGWTGRPDDFIAALSGTRLLDKHPEGCWALHDWAEHQPWVIGAPERVAKARKAVSTRWNKAREDHEKQAEGPGRAMPAVLKMPEVGSKNEKIILGEYSENTRSIPVELLKSQSSNTPLLLPSSSSTLQKGIKTPPVSSSEDTAPKGAPSKKAGFVRPSIEDVTAYCLERGKGLDPQAWFDHYTANGWKVGPNAMQDWRAAVRQWERNPIRGRQQAARQPSVAEKLLAEAKGGYAS